MLRKISACLSLFLLVFVMVGAEDSQNSIAAARGRKKLDLILRFFQGPELPVFRQKEPQLPERYAREALELAKQLHDRHAEGFCENYLARQEYLKQRYEPALEGYYRARRIFRERGDQIGEADVNKEIDDLFSSIFHVFSDYGRAGEYYAKNLALSRQSRDPREITRNLVALADVCHVRGDLQKAIPLYLEAL
ncbi:MAG TPA: hypothetical protein VF451_07950, partial [Acidobacteriota bacterium]